MKLIGENIHIISKNTKTAIEKRDKSYIQKIAQREIESGVDWVDLNIGPARRGSEGVMEWLVSSISEVGNTNFSFDTSNTIEIRAGLSIVKSPEKSIINSASGDPERLENMTKIASEFNTNLIALTMSNETGIPKDPEGRLEIASIIIEKTNEYGIDNSKIYLDPLVLPVSVDQNQTIEALNSIRVFKESFDPSVSTIIGLSNVSNGSPKDIRSLINRVYLVLAMGCGLDAAIIDAFDSELLRTIKLVENNCPETDSDKLLLNLYSMMQEFGELDDVDYNKSNPEEEKIFRTAMILLNKNIYAHNYLDEKLLNA